MFVFSIVINVTGVGFRWRIVGDMTGWLCSSVVECSHCQRKALGSSPGRATIFHLLQLKSWIVSFFNFQTFNLPAFVDLQTTSEECLDVDTIFV